MTLDCNLPPISSKVRRTERAKAATGESASYIEVVGGRMDLPAGIAMAHRRLDALYGNG
jgi:hypothetical protein